MREFDPAELRTPFPQDLIDEMNWEEQMDKGITEKYSYME
jgi:hypothetical protein